MNRFIPLVFAIALTISIDAQTSGIQFQDYSWEMALQEAKEQNKIIFVDAYTTWCGPCKWLDKNVFSNETVGDFYNQHFVNIKLDMEKGEGLTFAKNYKVKAYPTLLFINGEGSMVHRGMGAKPVDLFIDLGHAASDPDRQIGTLEYLYQEGNREESFLKKYALALYDAGDKRYTSIAGEYLGTQDDWKSQENTEFLFSMAIPSSDNSLYQYIYANRKLFYDQIGKEKVDGMIRNAINNGLRKRKQLNVENVSATYAEAFPKEGARYAMEYEIQQLLYMKNKNVNEKFLAKASEYGDKFDFSSWNFANSVAWRVYEISDDPAMLEKAKNWTMQSIALEGNYFNHDTMAAICYKLKEKKLAIKHANLAIRLAKQKGIDSSGTQKLLEEIEMLD